MKKQLAALLCGTMLMTAALSGCTMNSPVEGKAETTTAAKTADETEKGSTADGMGDQAVQKWQYRRQRSVFWRRHFRQNSSSTSMMD